MAAPTVPELMMTERPAFLPRLGPEMTRSIGKGAKCARPAGKGGEIADDKMVCGWIQD